MLLQKSDDVVELEDVLSRKQGIAAPARPECSANMTDRRRGSAADQNFFGEHENFPAPTTVTHSLIPVNRAVASDSGSFWTMAPLLPFDCADTGLH